MFPNHKSKPVAYGRLAHLRTKVDEAEQKSEDESKDNKLTEKELETMKSLSSQRQSDLMNLDESVRKMLLQRYQARIERNAQKEEESDNSKSLSPSS